MTMQEEVAEKTGGLKGQEGYGNKFENGRYKDDTVAESSDVDDRAGSYESGYRAPNRDDALDAHNPDQRRMGTDKPNPHVNDNPADPNPHVNAEPGAKKRVEDPNPHVNDNPADPNPHVNAEPGAKKRVEDPNPHVNDNPADPNPHVN